jgi:hypothetical protein
MKTIHTTSHQGGYHRSISAFCLIAAVVFSLGAVTSSVAGQETDAYSTTAGSGDKYKTVIERNTTGDLSQEDFRQVTVLSSRVLLHLNEAIERLIDDQPDEVQTQIEHAQNVTGIVRDMLPVTTVTTRVEDSDGKVVYDYTEEVQDDRIPIYESTLMVEVVSPIIEAQKDEAAVQGVALQDADFIYTSALLDLGYVERKLRRAADLLESDKDQALRQLYLAQTQGLNLKVNKEDSPLVKAQAALQLAERMVGENKVAGAKANMQLARLHLETYQSLLGDPDAVEVRALREKMDELGATFNGGGMNTKEARDKSRGLIQGFWETVTGWMAEEPGEAHIVVDEDAPKEEGKEQE